MRVDLDEIEDRIDMVKGERNRHTEKRGRPRKKKHKLLKFCSCLILATAVIIFIVYLTIKMLVVPTIFQVNNVQSEFPAGFELIKFKQAQTDITTSTTTAKIVSFVKSAPKIVGEAVSDYLWHKIKQKITPPSPMDSGQIFKKNEIAETSTDQLANYLSQAGYKQTDVATANWNYLKTPKEGLVNQYKKELSSKGFEFKENITDYKISLGFWKGDEFGILNFKDATGSPGSIVDLIINILK